MNLPAWLEAVVLGFNTFVLYYFVALNSVYFTLFVVSLREVVRHVRRRAPSDDRRVLQSQLTRPISILIPAHDEETTIVETVRSVLGVHYAEFEVVVINDGSGDDTLATLDAAFELRRIDGVFRRVLDHEPVVGMYRSSTHPRLLVLDKEHGGKADALNAGINASSYPLFCSFDADSIIEDDALLRVVKPFLEHPDETVATGGIVRIANGCTVRSGRVREIEVSPKWLPGAQVVEYLREFLVGRVSWSSLHSIMIISGAFGLYRKDVVLEAGGYVEDTATEDLELILRLHRHMRDQKRKYRMVFVPDPVCWTEAPETLRVLQRQRTRWHRGLLQSLWKHRALFLRRRYGQIGLVALPFFVLFEALGPLVEFFGYLFVLLAALGGFLEVRFLLLFLFVAVFFGIFLSMAAVLLDELSFRRYPGWVNFARMIVGTFTEHIGYRQIVVWFKVRAFFHLVFRRGRWGEMERRGFQDDLRSTKVRS